MLVFLEYNGFTHDLNSGNCVRRLFFNGNISENTRVHIGEQQYLRNGTVCLTEDDSAASAGSIFYKAGWDANNGMRKPDEFYIQSTVNKSTFDYLLNLNHHESAMQLYVKAYNLHAFGVKDQSSYEWNIKQSAKVAIQSIQLYIYPKK